MVIELTGLQFGLNSYALFQKGEFDLKLRVWFQTKIARHEVQLPLYYIHFEITQFFVNINIYLSLQETLFLKKRNRRRCCINYANNNVVWQNSLLG